MAKMSDDQLAAIVTAATGDALGAKDGQLMRERAVSLDYYFGRPFGNEVEGRSQVVSTDVADTIEWILPSLMRIFASGDQVVKFEPQGPEDEQVAQQATDYVNHIFHVDNHGFLILHNWFKDGLLSKNGIVKVRWDVSEDVNYETYEGLSDPEFIMLGQDPDVEITEHTEHTMDIGEQAVTVHDVKVKRKKTSGKIVVEPIPPEEFLISREARDSDTARMVGHRRYRTASDLIDDGYSQDLIDSIGGGDDMADTSEALARQRYQDSNWQAQTSVEDQANRRILVTEAYIRVDYDGDGIAELRMVTMAGKTILENEVVDVAPFADLTPILMPHRWVGRSVAELVQDIQLIKSTLWRQMLDNAYLTTNPRVAVIQDQVNIDDLLTVRPGGIVRMQSAGAVTPLETPFVAGEVFPMLEYLDSIRENRTGVTRYNQGLDANTLNKTASGLANIMSAAQQRIELIARIYAETGVRKLFKLILRQVSKHQQAPREIRLKNTWVPMDPRTWNNEMDCTVTVGLGTGNQEARIGRANGMLQVTEKLLQDPRLSPLVPLDKLFNQIEEFVKAAGFKDADRFYADPGQGAQMPPMPQQQPQADPAKMAEIQSRMQIEKYKIDTDAQIKREQMQLEHAKAVAEAQKAAAEMAFAARQADKTFALDVAKADHEAALGIADHAAGRQDAAMQQQNTEADREIAAAPAQEAQAQTSKVDQLMELLTQMRDEASTPSEVVRENGQVAGIKRGNTVRRVVRDDAGQIVGLH